MNQIDATLAALADPARRRVVELLQSEPLRASALAQRTNMSRAAISRHLRIMERSGLVAVETPDEDARGRRYRLQPDALIALGAWLDQVQAFWSEQLDAFKGHAERTRRRGQ